MQPFESRGRFELAGGELSRWTPLLRDYLRSEMTDGRLHVRADYSLAAGTNGFDATVTNGVVKLTRFKVKDLNNGDIVTTIPFLSVEPIDFDLRGRNLHIGQVRLGATPRSCASRRTGHSISAC